VGAKIAAAKTTAEIPEMSRRFITIILSLVGSFKKSKLILLGNKEYATMDPSNQYYQIRLDADNAS